MNSKEKSFFSTIDISYPIIKIKGVDFYLKNLISTEGFKSVVWQAKDRLGLLYVLKFATYDDYIEKSVDQEMSKVIRLNRYHQFAKQYEPEIKEFTKKNEKFKCVVFPEEYIEGHSISKINNEIVTIPFILGYIEKITEALNILKELNLRHDDLHEGNVLLVKSLPGFFKRDDYDIKIIDFGSLKNNDEPLKENKKGFNDLGSFTKHIAALFNKMLFTSLGNRRSLGKQDRMFIIDGVKILNTIIDTDKNRALTNPQRIFQEFKNLYSRNYIKIRPSKTKLADPFEYISAEQISDDKILLQLFAESCPWVTEIKNSNPIILTGPRGCGKSMIFRRFSLKVLLKGEEEILDDLDIISFYVSCSSELSNRFSIINSQQQALYLHEEIIHFFNLTLLKEIFQTLILITDRKDSFTKFGIDEGLQYEIYQSISKMLNIKSERKLKLQGVPPFKHLFELIKFELNHTYTAILQREKIKSSTPLIFITEISQYLESKIPFFTGKKITYLIDDYSVHRIPEHVQIILNQIIFDRQGKHVFKLSSEKYGVIKKLLNKAMLDLGREYIEIDIGRTYINLSESSKELKRFSLELLNHRLELAGYNGRAEKLLGTSKYESGSLGKQIAANIDRNSLYHGVDTISQICSGDISTLIEIYRNVFEESSVTSSTTTLISRTIQHKAITSVSKNFLETTKSLHPYGLEMYNILFNFGSLCRKILTDGKSQRDTQAKVPIPNETTRIEIQDQESIDIFSEKNSELYKELIRRAIFIELEQSRERHFLSPSKRLQLRRIYCPSFLLSMAKNTAIKWSPSEFKHFLNDPLDKCKIEFNSRWKKDESQNKLFNDEL